MAKVPAGAGAELKAHEAGGQCERGHSHLNTVNRMLDHIDCEGKIQSSRSIY